MSTDLPLTAELKKRVLHAFVAAVKEELASATQTQKETAAAATHEEARAESDKDTRGLEQSYLARGLAKRVIELRAQAAALSHMTAVPHADGAKIAGGALVKVRDDDDAPHYYFITGAPGGLKVHIDGADFRLVSTETPVGKALRGRMLGDEVEIKAAGKKRSLELSEAC